MGEGWCCRCLNFYVSGSGALRFGFDCMALGNNGWGTFVLVQPADHKTLDFLTLNPKP